jgi:hypothetical protein
MEEAVSGVEGTAADQLEYLTEETPAACASK